VESRFNDKRDCQLLQEVC